MTKRPVSSAARGKVWLVGAGPGAADLLTVRAARLLAEADIVFYDALVDPDVLALAVRAQRVPVGKRGGRPSTSQRFINKRLIDAAHRFSCVVRLKGGDPMMFGRAQEEIDELVQQSIDVEVVPGVSAAFSAAAGLMTSLTRRGISRHVLMLTPRFGENETAHDWARPAATADTAVIYMAGRLAAQIATGLIQAGVSADRPAVIVENASLPDARAVVARLDQLGAGADQIGAGPALLMIGEVFRPLLLTAQAEAMKTQTSIQTIEALLRSA